MAELECFYTIPTHHTAPGWICHRRGSTPRCNRTNTITSSNEHTVESSLSSFNPCDDSSPPDFVPAVGMLPPVPFRILPRASGWWWETASLPVKGSQRVFTISQPVPLSTLYRTHRCLVVIVTSLLLRTVLFSYLRQVRQLSLHHGGRHTSRNTTLLRTQGGRTPDSNRLCNVVSAEGGGGGYTKP